MASKSYSMTRQQFTEHGPQITTGVAVPGAGAIELRIDWAALPARNEVIEAMEALQRFILRDLNPPV